MKRKIYQSLIKWKNSEYRKPLILTGARQVGKTWILKEFGNSEYNNVVYLNFEDDRELDELFSRKFDKNKIIEYLSLYSNSEIKADSTLIIMDEIQNSPSALNSLKYFLELASEFHIVCAGSLLGITLTDNKNFPVGKVSFLNMYPMSFIEFLQGTGNEKYLKILENKVSFESFPSIFHNDLIEILKIYCFVGGMPEVVKQWSKNHDSDEVRKIQKDIIRSYIMDISRHAEKKEIMRILQIWDSIPVHLSKENRKFIFSVISKSARSREYETSLKWLDSAGLIYRAWNISMPKFPLSAYAKDNFFKVFLFDTGILGCMAELPPEIIMKGNEIFTHFKGAMIENFVSQELKFYLENKLYYWTSFGTAEVDFIFQYNEHIYPLEVKSGKNLKSKSLKVYAEKYSPEFKLRTSLQNLEKIDTTINFPLYALNLLLNNFPWNS